MAIKWTKGNGEGGSYRTMEELPQEIQDEMRFSVLPSDMSELQKQAGIFCKVWLKMPYAKEVLFTVGVEKTEDEAYNGFKFRLISVSNGKDNIANPIDFETMGKMFQTLHNGIALNDGTIVNEALLTKAQEFATLSEPNRQAYKARVREARKTLREVAKARQQATASATEPTVAEVVGEIAENLTAEVE